MYTVLHSVLKQKCGLELETEYSPVLEDYTYVCIRIVHGTRRTGGERRNNRNNESFSRCRPLRFDTITMSMQLCEIINKIRLTRTTIQHNGEAGMRDNDLHRQRLQQRTVGLALVGLEKGGLFVLKKTVGFALIKAD